jgi:hypothetical protein
MRRLVSNQRSVTLDGLQTNRARHDQSDRHDPGRVGTMEEVLAVSAGRSTES